MLREGMTVREAAEKWTEGFSFYPYSMIELLWKTDWESWREITLPRRCDRVRVHDLPEDYERQALEAGDKPEREGEIENCARQCNSYRINLDDGAVIEVGEQDFEVVYDDILPSSGMLWAFGNNLDNDWLTEGGLTAMCDCGFRVFEHDEWGYFFGLDGGGYDFYPEHWMPLYRARGIEWHDPKAEKERQMQNKGYRRGKLGGKAVWLDGQNNVVEEAD